MKVRGRIDYYFEQMGIDTYSPRFSWTVDGPCDGFRQSKFKITVAGSEGDLRSGSDLLWDSGFVDDKKAAGAVYAGAALEGVTRYYWKVSLELQRPSGESVLIESEALSFVTGKLGGKVRLGQWITNGTAKPFYARRGFEVKAGMTEAYALVSGLGQFNLFMNGDKVSRHVLDPGWTNYNKKVQYVQFDITPYLREGRNLAGVEVGNGWYIGETDERYFHSMPPEELPFIPPNPTPYKPFSDCLALCGELHIIYADGKREIIGTDEEWRTRQSAVKLANVYGSEIYDARDYPDGWDSAGFDDGSWDKALIVSENSSPRGELSAQGQPPVVIARTYEAISMRESESGSVIVDFGQNMSGLFEICVTGGRGAAVHIYPAEKLDASGNIDQKAKGWTEVGTYQTYILAGNGKPERWKPAFAYSSGRYVMIKGVTLSQDEQGLPVLHEARAHFVTSASETAGKIECSDARFQGIYELVEKAVESNLQSVHTDCPGIEKLAWLETNHLMAPSVMFMKDVNALWYKILSDIRLDQHGKGDGGFGDGMVPSKAPCYEAFTLSVPGIGSFYDSIAWGVAVILAAYWHYMYYGDLEVVRENYEAGSRYLAYLRTKVNADGFINHGLGDWGNPEPGSFARENVETAFYYAGLRTMAYFAGQLGKEDDRERFKSLAEEVKVNYNDKLLAIHPETGRWCYRAFEHKDTVHVTQACEALPLYWGMVPQNKRDDVADSFLHTLKKAGTFVSGEIGLCYIIQTMRELGMNDMICEFMLREEHPSYYRFVLDGETTLPEYWEENARSHNHDMMGHIAQWYYNGIAGILPAEPGFARVRIKPYLPQGMEHFLCTYRSVRGVIWVEMKVTDAELAVSAGVPDSIEAEYDWEYLKNIARERGLHLTVSTHSGASSASAQME